MAGIGLLALIDDIGTMLDDVGVMTKTAASKTAGVLGDDLAVNAQALSGKDVAARRELPIIWAVFLGSLRNKLMIVPMALLLSHLVPWLIGPILMIGGAYLCYEGAEKVWHHLSNQHDEVHGAEDRGLPMDPEELERQRIGGAIRTDFILSAEIVVITLGLVQAAPLLQKILVVSLIALVMTFAVYGLVALIVKMDDAGMALIKKPHASAWSRRLGGFLLVFAPKFLKFLGFAGTLAMWLVGGGIIVHGMAALHHFAESFAHDGWWLTAHLGPLIFNLIVGILVGAVLLLGVGLAMRVWHSPSFR